MNLISRVKGILVNPEAEWQLIEREPGEIIPLFRDYAGLLAIIPALAGFIGLSVIGTTNALGTFRIPLASGLSYALFGWFAGLVIVYAVAVIIDQLAPSFQGRRDMPAALKLAVYSFTPAWIAGIFLLLPGLRFLSILGLYGLYVLWLGLPVLMKVPRERALVYAVGIVACAILMSIVVTMIQNSLLTYPQLS